MRPPVELLKRMKYICEDYRELENCYDKPHYRGLRVNRLKMSALRAAELPFELGKIPFSECGFRLLNEMEKPGAHPLHHAGAYYMQEPSAMSAAAVLSPEPSETVLDMCASPGGKSTQMADMMKNRGVLWSNEYVRSRVSPLVSNIERLGIQNAVVTSLHPDMIAAALPEYFDKVLVDAPCSGEGMLRREAAAAAEWSVEHVRTCAARQRGILGSAAECLRKGGTLVYSTCTFSPEEDELAVAAFLRDHRDFTLEKISCGFGREGLDSARLKKFCDSCGAEYIDCGFDTAFCRRAYPMDGGEGHFIAKMRKLGEGKPAKSARTAAADPGEAEDMLRSCLKTMPNGVVREYGGCFYLLPEELRDKPPLPVIRAGVLIGRRQKNRIEPEHALFMSQPPENCAGVLELSAGDERLAAFLRGEEISAEGCSGFTAVSCDGMVTGFGKASGGVLKNRYPKGLRNPNLI